MSIKFHVLGKPGRDNALFLQISTGNSFFRLLFDCGENIFAGIKQHDVKNIDYLFFSHLHIDHIAGFDYLFRRNYERKKPFYIFGPEGTSDVIHHRLLGYTWNLLPEEGNSWIVSDIFGNKIESFLLKASEGFKNKNIFEKNIFEKIILKNADFCVETVMLDHRIPSAGYKITERESFNIDKEKLAEMNLEPGQWLEKVKDSSLPGEEKLNINNQVFSLNKLRNNLLKIAKGESLSYLTDFILNDSNKSKAVNLVRESDVMICESQYLQEDILLAKKNYHLTSVEAAEIAKDADVKKLILFHLSDRYRKEDYLKMIEEARIIFPETYYPEIWGK